MLPIWYKRFGDVFYVFKPEVIRGKVQNFSSSHLKYLDDFSKQ